MLLKFISHDKENHFTSHILNHTDIGEVKRTLNGFFKDVSVTEENYTHRVVLFAIVTPLDTPSDLMNEAIENPDNQELLMTWHLSSFGAFEEELVTFLETYDIHDLLDA